MIRALRRLLAPIDRFLDAYCRDLASRELAARGLADAEQAPDFVEPPEETPTPWEGYVARTLANFDALATPEPQPVYQELVSEIVYDAAASRYGDCGQADLEAWEDDRIPAYVERGQR